MKKHILSLFFWGMTVTALFFAASCGKEKSTPAKSGISFKNETVSEVEPPPEIHYTLTLTAPPTGVGDVVPKIVDAYNRKYPNQAVQVNFIESLGDQTGVYGGIFNQMSEGGGPDILVCWPTFLREFYKGGLLLPIEELYTSSIKNEFAAVSIESGSADGVLVGFAPEIVSVSGYAVSKELYSKSTWTVHEVLETMEDHPELERTFVYNTGGLVTIRSTSRGNKEMTAAEYYNYDTIYFAFRRALFNPPFLDFETGTCDYTCDEFINLLMNMRRDKLSDVKSNDVKKTGRYLAEMFRIGSMSDVVNLLLKYNSGYSFLGKVGSLDAGVSMTCDSCFVINKNTTHLDEVTDFFDFLLSPEGQLSMGAQAIPAIKDAYDYFVYDKPGVGLVWGNPESGDSKDIIRLRDFGDIDNFKKAFDNLIQGYYALSEGIDAPMEIITVLNTEIENYLEDPENPRSVAANIQKQVNELLLLTKENGHD